MGYRRRIYDIACGTVVLMVAFSNICTGEDMSKTPESQIGEYCQHETMRGRCRWKSEVIVMTSARWGRMKTGRCLDIHPNSLAALGHDPMFLGCSADVLSIVDRKCSGRSECDIRISDQDLDTVTPCYPDLKRYLEASYTCVKVVQETRTCLVSVTAEPQFISISSSVSDLNSVSSCGSKLNPWRLEAPAGQQINISLIDFVGSTPRGHSQTSCIQYGYVLEKVNKRNKTICAVSSQNEARSERGSAVYTSDTSNVEIVLLTEIYSSSLNYLIEIHVVGCTNMIPPDNAWLKRQNNDIVIGCYLSQQTWQLKCDGHEWKGQVGECIESVMLNKPLNAPEMLQSNGLQQDFKLMLSMVVIAGAAIVICIIVIAIGVMCLQRCKQGYEKKQGCATYAGECRPIREVKDGSMLLA